MKKSFLFTFFVTAVILLLLTGFAVAKMDKKKLDSISFKSERLNDQGFINSILRNNEKDNYNAYTADISTQAISETEWDQTFGGTGWEDAYSVQQTSDKGYIIAGTTTSIGAGFFDAWIIKTDSSGNEEWSRTFGGSGFDVANSVQQTSDGGYILAGFTNSFGAGSNDFWLIKTDSLGNEEWSRTFGGAGDDTGFEVQQTSGGGYVVVGYTYSFGAGNYDIWIIKTDASGNEEWSRTFGGSNDDKGYSVKQTSDNGYIIAGYTRSSGAGSDDAWLIKTDSSGNLQWSRTFGGAGRDKAYSVQQSSDGGYILAASTESSGAGLTDVWIIKTDSSGNEEWSRTFGGAGREEAFDVQQTLESYMSVGYSSSFGDGSNDIWLIKTDSSGNLEEDKTFGSSFDDTAYEIGETSDEGQIIAGSTNNDFWLIKLKGHLIAHYKFEGDALDNTGKHDGVNYGAEFTTGKISQAASFDGVYDYVEARDSFEVAASDFTDEVSVALWMKSNDNYDYHREEWNKGIFRQHPSIPENTLSLRILNNQADVTYSENNQWVNVLGPALSTDVWYYLVYTLDNTGKLSFYVNGVKVNEASTSLNINVPYYYYIGLWDTPVHNGNFDGLIDEVRIYNKALSQEEISFLYNIN